MEARKIIQFGNSSHIITIPNSWIKENKLKKGDLIFVEKNGNGELVLMPKEKKEERKEGKTIIINTEKKERASLARELISAYLAAPSLIVLEGRNLKENENAIKSILNGLSGIEVIAQTANQIKIKNVLDIREAPLKELLRRMDNLVRSMVFEIKSRKADSKLSKVVQETDQEVNKLFFLILKIIKEGFYEPKVFKQLNISITEAFEILSIVSNLEHIADELKELPHYLGLTSVKEKQQISPNLAYLEGLYVDTLSAYHTNDKKMILAVYKKGREFYRQLDKMNGKKEVILIYQILRKIENALYQINKTLLDSIFFEK